MHTLRVSIKVLHARATTRNKKHLIYSSMRLIILEKRIVRSSDEVYSIIHKWKYAWVGEVRNQWDWELYFDKFKL